MSTVELILEAIWRLLVAGFAITVIIKFFNLCDRVNMIDERTKRMDTDVDSILCKISPETPKPKQEPDPRRFREPADPKFRKTYP